jgi:hypothetical protein
VEFGCLKLIQRRHELHPITCGLSLLIQACDSEHADIARWLHAELRITKADLLSLYQLSTKTSSSNTANYTYNWRKWPCFDDLIFERQTGTNPYRLSTFQAHSR